MRLTKKRVKCGLVANKRVGGRGRVGR